MEDYLIHYGILGMKWGIRRFQNADGTLTPEGKKRYLNSDGSLNSRGIKAIKKGKINNPVSDKKADGEEVVEKKDYSSKSMINNRKVSELTTQEINDILTRIEKEKKLSEILYKPTTKEKIVKMLKQNGKKAAKNLGMYAATYFVSRALEENIGKEATKQLLNKNYKDAWAKQTKKVTNNKQKKG